ncbi:MAG: hypothetical protein SXG53_26620, partial [Pseudomonadota bacterium]|nr:hypothetical protein [Pseudomonadota bacterium]
LPAERAVIAKPRRQLADFHTAMEVIMNTTTGSNVKTAAIEANLAALHSLLTLATRMTAEGCQYMRDEQRDGAIGAIFPLASILDEAKALYIATIALHRSRLI